MKLDEALDGFCAPDAGPRRCRELISVVAANLACRAGLPTRRTDVPVLRAGMAMVAGVRAAVGEAPTMPAMWTGTARSGVITFTSDLSPSPLVVVLEVVVATGHTVTAVLDAVADSGHTGGVLVLAAFAGPEGLTRISAHAPTVEVLTGRVVDSVGSDGRLRPSTCGDAGDKLFAAASPADVLRLVAT